MIVLNANEVASPVPVGAPDQLLCQLIERYSLNRYPDPQCRELRAAIADYLSVDADRLVPTNGSDEALQLLAHLGARRGQRRRVAITTDPCFAMYPLIAELAGLRCEQVPCDRNGALDEERLLAAVHQHDPALLLLATPNNPTGRPMTVSSIQRVASACRGLVVIDAAYAPYDGGLAPYLQLIGDNVAVTGSLSKIGFAGVRVGFTYTTTALARDVFQLRSPYAVSTLAQALGVHVLQNGRVAIESTIQETLSERERMRNALSALPGLRVIDSAANFLLISVGTEPQRIRAELERQGILLRWLPRATAGEQEPALRLTIGTAHENDRVLSVLRSSLVTAKPFAVQTGAAT